MRKVMGIIFQRWDHGLQTFTMNRGISTIPFGGRYRLIDFPLSNLVNANIHSIGVLGGAKYGSLIDHLGTGQEWSLHRKTQDLAILPALENYSVEPGLYFDLRELLPSKLFIENQSTIEMIIFQPSNQIDNLDFKPLMDEHFNGMNDVTIVTGNGRIDEAIGTPDENRRKWQGREILAVMVQRTLIMQALQRMNQGGSYDLLNLIRRNQEHLRIKTLTHKGYYREISDVSGYYQANLDLLEASVRKELFRGPRTIYTKSKDNHPTQYFDGSFVNNAWIASGCQIAGIIQNSIVSRESMIGEGTVIKNSILMQRARIGKDVHLEHVILDKAVTIRDRTVLKGSKDEPIVISKGSVI
jgi:glucose-1-phosphate adenylyltransferase